MIKKRNNDKLYIIEKLENGEPLNIIFMSHNAHWTEIEKLSDHYKNCKIKTTGRGIKFIEYEQLYSNWSDKLESYDLIILRETHFIEQEYNNMKELAHIISKKENKPVTIGFSYFNPNFKKIDWNQEHIIKIARITNDEEREDTITTLNLTPIELANYVLIEHDNQTHSKVKKR